MVCMEAAVKMAAKADASRVLDVILWIMSVVEWCKRAEERMFSGFSEPDSHGVCSRVHHFFYLYSVA